MSEQPKQQASVIRIGFWTASAFVLGITLGFATDSVISEQYRVFTRAINTNAFQFLLVPILVSLVLYLILESANSKLALVAYPTLILLLIVESFLLTNRIYG